MKFILPVPEVMLIAVAPVAFPIAIVFAAPVPRFVPVVPESKVNADVVVDEIVPAPAISKLSRGCDVSIEATR